MRSFSVLTDVPDLARWAAWLAPTELDASSLDARTQVGKGRLVAFSEALLAAVDLVGFCAFTAGALLADGLVELDALARHLGFESATDLRVAGASYVLLRRHLPVILFVDNLKNQK